MRIATIDIGTNTLLLLIVEADSGTITEILHDEQVIARLGKGVDAERKIAKETIIRVCGFLNQYRRTCDQFHVDMIRAVGTSAVRDASNSIEFIETVERETGIRIEILTGEEEARWSYLGGISDFRKHSDLFSLLDIGGGSTEIIVGNSEKVHESVSIDIGAVRITERILKGSPPDTSSLIEAREFIAAQLKTIALKQIKESYPVGVAGTLTTLASLHQQLPSFQRDKINGYALHYNDVCSMFRSVKDKTITQIQSIPQIDHGRSDIIVAGMMILIGYMEQFSLEQIVVSTRGLRYGIVFREFETGR